ncbi:MAG: putative porin [Bacteroidales bacterium]|nr:putative porin [Bacteroidales bacterium]
MSIFINSGFIYTNIYAQIETTEVSDSTENELSDEVGREYAPAFSYFISSFLPTLHENIFVDTNFYLPYNEDITLYSHNLYARMNCFGQAGFAMNFNAEQKHGFTYKSLPYTDYLRTMENWKLYDVESVYANLSYHFTNGKENHFAIDYAQKIYQNLSLNVSMQSVVGTGRYVRQAVRDVNMGINLNYFTLNKRYGFSAYYILNYFKLQENGGLTDDGYFESKDTGRSTSQIPVRFANASNRLFTNEFLFRHYIALSNSKNLDSNRWGGGYFVHDLGLSTHYNRFTDNEIHEQYFDHIYLDSSQTNDFCRDMEFSTRLFWSSYQPDDTFSNKKNFIHFAAGAEYSFCQVKDTSYIYRTHLLTPLANLHIKLFNTLNINAKALFTVTGYNAGDITLEGNLSFDIQRKERTKHRLRAGVSFYNHTPDYFYTHLITNYFQWDNPSLKKAQTLHADFSWLYKNFEIGIHYFGLMNHTYLNINSLPEQLTQYTNVYQLSIALPFYIKGFGLQTQAYLQYADNEIIRIPYFAGRQIVYYGFHLFKKALYLQFGFDFTYNTDYYANAYNPVLQQFYLQNDKKIGNYGYLDFYLQAKIGRFTAKAKMTHLWGGLFGKHYFLIPHYPAHDIGFSVGIEWRFYD